MSDTCLARIGAFGAVVVHVCWTIDDNVESNEGPATTLAVVGGDVIVLVLTISNVIVLLTKQLLPLF